MCECISLAAQQLLDERTPLRHAGIFELILKFLQGDGFCVRSVSTSWKATYEKLLALGNARCKRLTARPSPLLKDHVHDAGCTSLQAVFASSSRVRLAIATETGLEFSAVDHPDNWRIQFYAGWFADVATLLVARELGLPFSDRVVTGAVVSGSISKLDWLLTEQHCPIPEHITSQCESIEMLRWLKQKGWAPTAATLQHAAEKPNNRVLLQYLIDEGCAVGQGCISASAQCNDFEQLKWLHTKGAPIGQSATWRAAHHDRRDVLE
jgi:hypothetical protein